MFTALNARGQGDRFEGIWGQYWQIVDGVRAVDEAVAAKAVDLRRAAGRRLPNGDALIAATAALAGATLVHRDPHFSAIPPALLQQIELPQK